LCVDIEVFGFEGRRRRCVSMDNNVLGILKLRIIKGINLAIRDTRASDPYVVVRMGDQVYIFSKPIFCFVLKASFNED